MNSCNAEHQQMLQDCAARESRLSEWERGFVQSLTEQLDRGRSLSPRQVGILDALWERVTATGAAL